MTGRMAGRVALVTGSTSGIGRGVAERFAREGASVMITGRREQLGKEVAASIQGAGGDAASFAADLEDVDAAGALIEATIERFGHLDTLINNAAAADAARSGDGALGQTTPAFWDMMYRSSLRSVLAVTQGALPHLRESGRGRIVSVSSVQAGRGMGWDVYSAFKSAMVGLTRSLAVSYAADGIAANCLCVGTVVVERTEDFWATEEGRRLWRRTGLTRVGRPEDIAHACVYLGSDEAAFVTGAELFVDGGMHAWMGFRAPGGSPPSANEDISE